MTEKPDQRRCVRCGNPVEPAATGRPAHYCGVGCRRAAEYEVARLDRRIARAQGELDDLPPTVTELMAMMGTHPYTGRTLKEHRAHLEQIIAASEERMRELLDESEGENEKGFVHHG